MGNDVLLSELLAISVIFLVTLCLAFPLGRYIAKVFKGEKTILDFLKPVENIIFKLCRIDPNIEMDWKQNLKALLWINLIWFFYAFIILCFQGVFSGIQFLNPDKIMSMEPTLAFNTAVSFVTNTNLQHYSGERGMALFSQLIIVCFLQFVSAGTGIAAVAILFKAIVTKSSNQLGNFYYFFMRSCTRILLPIAIIVALLLVASGSPVTFNASEKIKTLEGKEISVAQGMPAPIVAIKQLGTNGGGFYGTNSAHPFENPTYFTNIVESISILLIALAIALSFGYFANQKRFAKIIVAVMIVGFIALLIPSLMSEFHKYNSINELGINNDYGNMEGKESRIGVASSIYWSVLTTCTSNGSVNAMHDSLTPISGMMSMLGMQLNCIFGGVGVGWINMFMFIIIAVFISGLMVGRTPEFLGKKIEAREVKIAMIIILLHPLFILGSTALASYTLINTTGGNDTLKWLNNPGYHGFSEILYEFTSASANNGSGFEGLGDNTAFWNISTGIVMLILRFIPIIGPIAIGGSLAGKKLIPQSSGSLKIDTPIFGLVLFSVIVILGALLFFPALTLGPIAEHLLMIK